MNKQATLPPVAIDRASDLTALEFSISKAGVTRLLVVTVAVIHMLNVPAVIFNYDWQPSWGRHYISFFGVSGEGKLPTFYSGLTLLAAAALLCMIAKHERHRGGGFCRYWSALALIFTLMAMDELVSIHELGTATIRSHLGITGGLLYHAWVIPAMAFLLTMTAVYTRFLLALPARSRALFVTAGVIYVGGALGAEMAGGAWISAHGHGLAYGVISTIEEILEMTGIVVFLYALLDYLERHAPVSSIRVTG